MKLTGKQIFVFIEKAIGIGAVLFSCALFVYERGAKDQVKNESTLLLQKTVRHADSLAAITRQDQISFMSQLRQYQYKDSFQNIQIKNLTVSIQSLAVKIMTKDEFLQFISPYLTKDPSIINLPINKSQWTITGHPKDSIQ
jgi:hypothetical protein